MNEGVPHINRCSGVLEIELERKKGGDEVIVARASNSSRALDVGRNKSRPLRLRVWLEKLDEVGIVRVGV